MKVRTNLQLMAFYENIEAIKNCLGDALKLRFQSNGEFYLFVIAACNPLLLHLRNT